MSRAMLRLGSSTLRRRTAAVALGLSVGIVFKKWSTIYANAEAVLCPPEEEAETFCNWSGTHECTPKEVYQPSNLEELEAVVQRSHKNCKRIRPIGSALSPNGICFSDEALVSMAFMNQILDVDPEKMQVTVQAGARVSEVVAAIRPHGMTLQNFASIDQQQIGGFVQAGAHGTGATIPPVEQQVVGMKIVTPAFGTINITSPRLLNVAKVAVGTLGVLAEVTLQCVPAHKLIEKTKVYSVDELKSQHASLLQTNRHLRYMWLPSTNRVVVVTCNYLTEPEWKVPPGSTQTYTAQEKLQPLKSLLEEVNPSIGKDMDLNEASFADLRGALLEVDPLNPEFVKRVNNAEAEFWKRAEGIRVDYSENILGFECGGQQWVWETAFPCGTVQQPQGDIDFVQRVLDLIEKEKIPAASPIEQRWTASSTAKLSPAYSTDPDTISSWVGIIAYLPLGESEGIKVQRDSITAMFKNYKQKVQGVLADQTRVHWAKVEAPETQEDVELQLSRPGSALSPAWLEFHSLRRRLDPHGILLNDKVDVLTLASYHNSILDMYKNVKPIPEWSWAEKELA